MRLAVSRKATYNSNMETGILSNLRLGMTREEVVSAVGEPDDTGGTSRKHKTTTIYKYGDVEVHFELSKTGGLTLVYKEEEDGTPVVLLN